MSRSHDDTMQWIVEARAGSTEALGRLFADCRGYLLRVAHGELDTSIQAKGGASDIVQETFLEAQRDFGRFEGHSEQELLNWLRHRVRYKASKFRRSFQETAKRAAAREVSIDAGASSSVACPEIAAVQPSPIERVLEDERDQRIDAAVERLPADYKRVIDLRYRESLSFDEIGRLLGRSENSARKLWRRAIERLEHNLKTVVMS